MRYLACLVLLASCDTSAPDAASGADATALGSDGSGAPDSTFTPAPEDTAQSARDTADVSPPADDTASQPDDGGVPGGRTGLEGHCDRYRACGGTYYESAEACIDATLDYWTACRLPELDAFGDCMSNLSCDAWGDPDAFNPADTPCSDAWNAVLDADCE